MKVTKKKDHYLFTTDKGEYHLSVDEYNKLGAEKAKEFVLDELNKKSGATYSNTSINFEQARELGFCEYGIKDFCKRLNLDLDATHTIEDVYNKLDVETFIEYPNECVKLFTNKVYNKFGGAVNLLRENRTKRMLNIIIYSGEVDDNILHTFAYKSALRVIDNFEKVYPGDDRPRKAIEAKRKFIAGEITEEELSAAASAARSAYSAAGSAYSAAYSAYSAARSAAHSADSAAGSAARSAAYSAAYSADSAYSAARSAYSAAYSADSAYSAARSAYSAELNFQIDTLINLITESEARQVTDEGGNA